MKKLTDLIKCSPFQMSKWSKISWKAKISSNFLFIYHPYVTNTVENTKCIFHISGKGSFVPDNIEDRIVFPDSADISRGKNYQKALCSHGQTVCKKAVGYPLERVSQALSNQTSSAYHQIRDELQVSNIMNILKLFFSFWKTFSRVEIFNVVNLILIKN